MMENKEEMKMTPVNRENGDSTDNFEDGSVTPGPTPVDLKTSTTDKGSESSN